MEAERVEAIEGGIDRIIERRAREREDANRVEELWKDSTRLHNEKRRREVRAAWYSHHVALCDVHRRLASEHEAKALSPLEAGGSKAVGPM